MKVSNVFHTLTLKQSFWKTKTFLKKLEYRFLVETTKIENTSFPFKTALSEIKVKAVITLFFRNIFASFRTSWKKLIWCTKDPDVHIRIFRKRWSLILGCFFPVSILNSFYVILVSFWHFGKFPLGVRWTLL